MHMNVESNGWKWSGRRSSRVVVLASLAILALMIVAPSYGQGGNTIVLGTIEAELKKKKVPVDLGKTPRSLTPLIAKAVSVHGGLRLAPPTQSRYSVYFSPLGGGRVKVDFSQGVSGIPNKSF